jgi:hypothetical protein
MPCLFCGAEGKLSREHVAPKWIKKLFPDLTDVEYERAFQFAGGELETHRRPGAPFDQTVKDFCEKCNTGWMAALERDVEPLLSPMIRDERASVDALGQERIAVWAAKTVLAFGPTNLGRVAVASQDLYRWFGANRMPLPGSFVWLARYTGTDQWPISFHQHGMILTREDEPPPPPGSPTNAFHAVLAIGAVAVCMFFADVPEGPVASGGSNDRRLLIWPISGATVTWPPEVAFTSSTDLRAESRRTPVGPAAPMPNP